MSRHLENASTTNRVNGFIALHDVFDPPRRRRIAYLAAGFLTVAVFGPYTPLPGVRMEQIAVYGSLLVGLLFWAWARPRFTTASVLIFVLLVVELLVALLGTVLPVTNRSSFGPGRTLAGLDNLLLPIAALVVGLMLVGLAADTTRLIRIVCQVLVVTMAINAVIAYFSSIYDLTGLLSPFWAPPDSRMTVATLSAQTGRFSGVLNQPAEAGTLYGVGVLAAIHLYRGQMLKMGISMLLLTIGGVLTVSKVFLLVAFPIAVWQAIRASGLRLRGLTVLFLLTAVAAAVADLSSS